MTLDIAVTSDNFQNFPFFRTFFDPIHGATDYTSVSTKMCAIFLFNCLSLSYFVLLVVLTSVVTNLTNTTSILHDFP